MIGDPGFEYRPIPSRLNYWAGCDGSIWRFDGVNTPRKRKLFFNKYRRRYYVSFSNGKIAQVARLVLEAFVGPCPDGMECCHGPGGGKDNRISNLRWGTPESNDQDVHRFDEMSKMKGEGNHRAVITKFVVLKMVELKSSGLRRCDIARQLNLHQRHVTQVLSGYTWNHVTGIPRKISPLRKRSWHLTEQSIEAKP